MDEKDKFDILAERINRNRRDINMRDDDFVRYLAERLRWVDRDAKDCVRNAIKEALDIDSDISSAIETSRAFHQRED